MENLDDINVFLKVVEKKSFKGAAGELRVSPSVVSKRIGQLEETLGVQLLKRSTRRLTLTGTGAVFYERCRKIFDELGAVREATASQNQELKGTLKLQMTVGVGRHLVMPAIKAFMDRYPEITFDLTIGSLPANLLEHDLDAVIIQWVRVRDSSLEYRTLAPVRYLVCAAPAYLATAGRPKSPKELRGFNCLIHEPQKSARDWRFASDEGEYRVRVKGNFRTNNSIMLQAALIGGLGIARLPDHSVQQDIAAGKLEVLFEDAISDGRSVVAVYPRNKYQPVRLRTFLDFLEEHLITISERDIRY